MIVRTFTSKGDVLNYKLILPLCLLTAMMSSSCKPTKKIQSSNDALMIDDPYGISTAEETGEVTDRLIACSQNEDCPEKAQALFWVAADMLSAAGTKTVEINGHDFGLTEDMSVDEVTNKITPQLDTLFDDGLPDYDFENSEFKKAHEMMKRAHLAGSVYASNELGLLHMEHLAIQNYDLARTYFEASWKKGDANGAYNLARLTRIETPQNHREILAYLEKAASTEMSDLKAMYMLGLEAFGTKAEKRVAMQFFKKNQFGDYGLRSLFEEQFNMKK